MDISWLGHACIRVRTQQTTVIMDPVDRTAGFDMGRPAAEVITVSNPHPYHSNVRGVRGDPLTIEGPGEYESRGVQITGIATYLTAPAEGAKAARNTAFVIESEELRLAHLGGLGAPLTAEQSEQLSNIDILILPIGGGATIDAATAARTVRALEPSVVIPVHYPLEGEGGGPDGPLARFVAAVGAAPQQAQPRVTLQRRSLTETLQVLLLEPRG